MKSFIDEFIKFFGKERLLFDEPLARYTSMRLGGIADYFFRAKKIEELTGAVKIASKHAVKYAVIGGGTNILVSDKGYRGIVIRNESANIKFLGFRGARLKRESLKPLPQYQSRWTSGRYGVSTPPLESRGEKPVTAVGGVSLNAVFLEVDSGIGINRLVRYAIDQGFGGLEAFLGQPGTVGGAIWINAHNLRLNKFIGQFCIGGRVLNKKGEVREVDYDYFKFSYDESSLQFTEDILLTAIFKLNSFDKDQMWQAATEALNYRKMTQPQGIYSAGCIFRNINKSEAMRLKTPDYTVSTGYLIDSLRLKGYKIGDAQVSETHGNFIINNGQAKAEDVLSLVNLIKTKVFERFGVKLKEEISILGEF